MPIGQNNLAILQSFTQYLQSQNIPQADISNDADNISHFLEFVDTNVINAYELEKYIQLLVDKNTDGNQIKYIAASLHRLYSYLNIVLPNDSALFSYVYSAVPQGPVVEKVSPLKSKLLPYTLTALGWIGLLGKLRILYLILLGVAGLASSSYIVNHPGVVTDARDSIKRFNIATSNQTASSINSVKESEVITSTAPQLDARYSDLVSELSLLSTRISALQSTSSTVNSTINKVNEAIDNYYENEKTGTTAIETGNTANISGLTVRVEELESLAANGFDVSKFKVVDGSGNVLSYTTGGTNTMEANSNVNVSGKLDVSKGLNVGGILKIKSDSNEPSDNPEGGLYFNTDNNQLYVSDGDGWNQVGKTYSIITGGALQLVNDSYGLISCSANELLKYSGGTWVCSSDLFNTPPSTFASLIDTPSSYSGMGGRMVRVGVGESSLEFIDTSGWDQNASNDLTTGTTFGGDVAGAYNTLDIQTGVVGSNEIASSGVTAGTYGGSTSLPVFTVDQDGRVTLASEIVIDTSSITTTGVIASGTWQGSVITVPYGGTGRNTLTDNGLLAGNGSNALQSVGVGTSGQVLVTNGSSQPVWASGSTLLNTTWLQAGNNSSSTDFLGTTNTTPLRIGVSSNEVLRISANGNVGVGTTNPLEKFHVTNGSILVDSTSPILISTLPLETSPQQISIYGKYAYVSEFEAGFKIVDISKQIAPVQVGAVNTSDLAMRSIVSGNYLYLSDFYNLDIYNIKNPTAPVLISTTEISSGGYDIKLSGNRLYLANAGNGIDILDVSNPAQVKRIGNYDTTLVYALNIDGNILYACDNTDGFLILDVSNPSSIQLKGSVGSATCNSLDKKGRYVYTAGSSFRIIDVANITNPSVVGTIGSIGIQRSVVVRNNFAYVSNEDLGLRVVDITNPASPTTASLIDTPGTVINFTINGRYGYLSDYGVGIKVYDLGGLEASTIKSGAVTTDSLNINNDFELGDAANISSNLNVGYGGIFSTGVVSIVNTGVTTNLSIPSLNVLSGSSNGAFISMQTTSPNNYALEVESTGISRLFVSGEGKVGIGTSNPSTFSLEIAGNLGPVTSPYGTVSTNTSQAVGVGVGYTKIINGIDGLPYMIATGGGMTYVYKCTSVNCTSMNNLLTSADNGSDLSAERLNDGTLLFMYVLSGALHSRKCIDLNCTSASDDTIVANISNNSLALGPDGIPVFSFYDTSTLDLRVVKCADVGCSTTASTADIDTTGNVGAFNSLRIGSDGYPSISYYDTTNGDLKFAKCFDSACLTSDKSQIDTTGDVGDYSSLVIGADNMPIISYHDVTNGDLKTAKCTNTSCTSSIITTLDTANNSGYNSIIIVSSNGMPIIVYQHDTGFGAFGTKTYIAYCLNKNCTSSTLIDMTMPSNMGGGAATSILIGTDKNPIFGSADGFGGWGIVHCGTISCISTSGAFYTGGYDLGSIAKYWNNVYAVNLWAKDGVNVSNFDVAEDYKASENTIEAGDVVAIDPLVNERITYADDKNESKVLGVVSTKPGFKLSDYEDKDLSSNRPVALAGRVPVKISKLSESIDSGDYLMISSQKGKAQKASKGHFVIGKALEKWSPDMGKDTIMMFVNLSFYTDNSEVSFSELTNDSVTGNLDIDLNALMADAINNPVKLSIPIYSRGYSVLDRVDVTGNIETETIDSLNEILSLANGKVQITKDGNIFVSNNLFVKDKITAKELEISTGSDKDSIGSGTIKGGELSVFIETKTISKNSKVFITSKNNKKLMVGKQEIGKGFEVKMDSPIDSDAVFDWFIVDENAL